MNSEGTSKGGFRKLDSLESVINHEKFEGFLVVFSILYYNDFI